MIAAANPNGQQYNQQLPLSYNLNVGEALLSRFDLIIIMKDVIDEDNDSRLAWFIINSHAKNHPQTRQMINQMKQYKNMINDYQRQLEQNLNDEEHE